MEHPTDPPTHATEEARAEEWRRRPKWITALVVLYVFLAFYHFISMSGGFLGFEPPYAAFESIALCIVCIVLAYGLWTLRTFAWYLWVILQGLYVTRSVLTILALCYFYATSSGEEVGAGFGFAFVPAVIALLILRYSLKPNIRRLFRIRVDSRRPVLAALGVSLVLGVVSFVGTSQPVSRRCFVCDGYTIDDADMLQSWEEFCFEMSEREFRTALGDFLDGKTSAPGSPVTTFHVFYDDTVHHSWEFVDSSLVEYKIIYHLEDETAAGNRAQSIILDYEDTYGVKAFLRSDWYLWRLGEVGAKLKIKGGEVTVIWTRVESR